MHPPVRTHPAYMRTHRRTHFFFLPPCFIRSYSIKPRLRAIHPLSRSIKYIHICTHTHTCIHRHLQFMTFHACMHPSVCACCVCVCEIVALFSSRRLLSLLPTPRMPQPTVPLADGTIERRSESHCKAVHCSSCHHGCLLGIWKQWKLIGSF